MLKGIGGVSNQSLTISSQNLSQLHHNKIVSW